MTFDQTSNTLVIVIQTTFGAPDANESAEAGGTTDAHSVIGSRGPIIDFHVHLAPSLSADVLTDLGVTKTSRGHYAFDGRVVEMDELYRPDVLGQFLAGWGTDHGCVSVPPPFYRQHLSVAEAAAWVPALNEGVRRACAGDARLLPLAYLPLEHPGLAVATAREHLGTEEFAGWTAAAGGNSCALEHPELDELWALLAADGRPLLLHPGKSPDLRLNKYYLDNLLGNPVETSVAAAELVFGGVLARHPHLLVILAHCGGVLPAVASRWQQGQNTARPGVNIPSGTVTELLHRIYVDCLAHEPAAMDLAEEVFGQDRLVLGTDWPFPMGLSDPYHAMKNRSGAFINKVAVENAARLLAHVPIRTR
ncbi:amidohydrolase family protein [Paenarthrobacter sp. NPDC056912]|uniref:amidohydrolase family protein n=1 Tax=Paenarthrobacter sp. NPDC056912 TaxID=3345965 RepID=UPI0036701A38